jgi:cyanophycin synthetase
VTVRAGEIFLVDGSGELLLSKLNDVPVTCNGQDVLEVENVLAAVAAAWSLGIDLAVIRAGIGNFHAFNKA